MKMVLLHVILFSNLIAKAIRFLRIHEYTVLYIQIGFACRNSPVSVANSLLYEG